MFTAEQLRTALADEAMASDLTETRDLLANSRLGGQRQLDLAVVSRLDALVVAALAAAPSWRDGDGQDLLTRAAEVAETLALVGPDARRAQRRLRSALLYELADLPMMAAAVISDGDGPDFLIDFFKRRRWFNSLAAEIDLAGDKAPVATGALFRVAVCEEALALAEFEHDPSAPWDRVPPVLEEAARHYAGDLSLTEVKAFRAVMARRASRATHLRTPAELLPSLRTINFPPELWDTQAQAIDAGLLDPSFDAWGLASPTGTGKTFMARLDPSRVS